MFDIRCRMLYFIMILTLKEINNEKGILTTHNSKDKVNENVDEGDSI